MLQLRTAGYLALDRLRVSGEFPPHVSGIEEIETVTDRFMQRFMEERLKASNELGPGFLLYELFDRTVRSRDQEHMDEASTSGKEKLELIRALDRMNDMTLAYRHQIDLLEPLIRETSSRNNGPVRILELAAGSGGLSFALAGHARKLGIDIEITATDIVPETIEAGNLTASERGLPVRFLVMNAFDFATIEKNTIDLVIISQSLHHFTPGQLAMMIARSAEHGANAFIGLDGLRSLLLLAGVPLVASLQGIPSFTGDGFTSARKFYSQLELGIIARIATGHDRYAVSESWPMSMLLVSHDNPVS